MLLNIGTQMNWVDDLKNTLLMSKKYRPGDVLTCDCQFCCGEWYLMIVDYDYCIWLGHYKNSSLVLGSMQRYYKIKMTESFHDNSLRLLYRNN